MRFEIGEILGRSLKITARGFIPFFLIGLITYVPLFLLVPLTISSKSLLVMGIMGFIGIVFTYVLAGSITYGVVQDLKGNKISIADCLSVGFQRMFPVLLVALVVGLCVLAGMLLFVVPGIILAVMLFVAVPSAVIEKPGIFGALDRSMALTKGFRWQIFFLTLIVGVASMIISRLLVGDPTVGMELDPSTTLLTPTEPSLGMPLLSMLVQMVMALFNAVVSAVVYYRLRQVKEDADIDDLAAVFE